jgi:antitoxin (DNA-binding transcriptional repressor) of toxin-antitoxin stability system
MLEITSTELKNHLGKYLELLAVQPLIITKNGKPIAQITLPTNEKHSFVDRWAGILAGKDIDLDEMKRARILNEDTD